MTRCTRCGKTLRSPVILHGEPFGSTCARIVESSRAASAAVVPSTDERQAELFPTLWQRIKGKAAEILSAWKEPWVEV